MPFFSFQIDDISRIHRNNSPNHFQRQETKVIMSLDGVSETKSTSTSLDVYSIKFEGCRDIFPVKIVRPIKKDSVDHKAQFASVLDSILLHYILAVIVGDNPKRAFFRDSMQHSSKFAYEYCFESGVPFCNAGPNETLAFIDKIKKQREEVLEQINYLLQNDASEQVQSLRNIVINLNEAEKMAKKQKKSSHIVWPSNTFNGDLRSKEKILDIVE